VERLGRCDQVATRSALRSGTPLDAPHFRQSASDTSPCERKPKCPARGGPTRRSNFARTDTPRSMCPAGTPGQAPRRARARPGSRPAPESALEGVARTCICKCRAPRAHLSGSSPDSVRGWRRVARLPRAHLGAGRRLLVKPPGFLPARAARPDGRERPSGRAETCGDWRGAVTGAERRQAW
jgi:hypothetical protein